MKLRTKLEMRHHLYLLPVDVSTVNAPGKVKAHNPHHGRDNPNAKPHGPAQVR